MPAKSAKQRRFMGAELQRKREGKSTSTGMSEDQLKDFAKSRVKKKPARGSGALTPVGQRTLAGYQAKWGAEEGHAKFEEAIERGLIDGAKMMASTKDEPAKPGVAPAAKDELSGATATKSTAETEDPRHKPRAASGAYQARPG